MFWNFQVEMRRRPAAFTSLFLEPVSSLTIWRGDMLMLGLAFLAGSASQPSPARQQTWMELSWTLQTSSSAS